MMKARNKLKFLILLNSKQSDEDGEFILKYSSLTDEDVESMYDIFQKSDDIWEARTTFQNQQYKLLLLV